jgi:hypothetical protein
MGRVGLIAVGGTPIYLGIRDWPQAPRPRMNIGVMIGRKIGVQVRRRW